MYVKVKNNTVQQYPYSVNQLFADNPNTSFPFPTSNDVLALWNVYPVTSSEQPTLLTGQVVHELDPVKTNGVWTQQWAVREATLDEINQKENEVREMRNAMLSSTDWRFRSDMSPSFAWIEYCQALRDISAQSSFPWVVKWPIEPN